MINLCHPADDIEQMLIVAELENARIPYFIQGQYFGSLYLGLQVACYNERTVMVPAIYHHDATSVIDSLRLGYTPSCIKLRSSSKLRMFLEAVFFGWVIAAGAKRN